MHEAARADLVFLTVSDDAIEPIASSLSRRAGQRVVHCEQLAPAHEAFYRELSRRQLALAERGGRLDEAQLLRMRELVGR